MWSKLKPWLFLLGFAATAAAMIRYSFTFNWDGGSNALVGAGVLLIILSLILNWKQARQLYKRRSTVYLTFSIVSAIVMLAILFLINFIVWLHPKQFDLTEQKFFTLSDQTIKVLGGLNKEVTVLAFYRGNDQNGRLDYLLRQYKAYNHRFKYRIVDPDRDPTLSQSYGVTRYKTVIMESGEKRLRVDDPSEGGLTNTILKLTQGTQKSIYFLTGHGEHNTDSEERDGYSHARKALEETNYEVKLLNLVEESKVPDDCAALVVTSARRNPAAAEMDKLQVYLNRGGGILLLLDPTPGVGFEDFLARYGVRIGNDVVIDASGAGRTIGAGPEVPLIQNYASSEITSGLTLATFYPRARSVTPMPSSPEGVRVVGLMQTSRSSWGETELGPGGGGARYDEDKDLKGPVTLAVQITKALPSAGVAGVNDKNEPPAATARIVAFGDSDFATNVHFNAQGNGDLFINSVNWLAGATDLIAIRPKKPENKRLDLTAQSNTVVFYICVLMMPAVPLTAGIWVLIKRLK